ncbi:hypothetical protein COLO4_12073 [Corchorus olitorius]|uniref:Uncharacterized protein n=1 Tax=Corchorus olitorius TaxID=93759 RepID=A0A1R3K2A3_9ROSI|nr:hypothetical protein COLO4_12073 [Corchorus olitorius]
MAPFSLRDRLQKNKGSKLQVKKKEKKNNGEIGHMQGALNRLKEAMESISEQHKNIREEQRKVRERFEAIQSECEELKRETRFIMQRTARTQIKVVLMFRILKAREQADLDTAAYLTQLLREIVERENEERQDSGDS